MSVISRLALLSVLLTSVACKSTEPVSGSNLPFHVAMIPIQEPDPIVIDPDEQDGATDMRFEPGMPRLSGAVRKALQKDAFTRVTLLDASGMEGLEGAKREQAWIDQADAIDADLILQCGVLVNPVVRKSKNGNQWYNYPLFFLGGPFTWFVPDNTYYVEVELSGDFFDLEKVKTERGKLSSLKGRVTDASQRFEEVDINFWDRADSTLDYGVSFVWPSTWLAQESDDLEEELLERVLDGVSQGFARSVQLKRRVFVQAVDIVPFYLDTDSVRIVRQGNGQLAVGGVVYKRDEGKVTMSSYRLAAGGESQEFEFPDGAVVESGPRSGLIKYEFRGALQPGREAEHLSLDLVGRSREPVTRTYTFRIGG